MIDYETYCLIRDLAGKGLTFSQIASETGRDQRTIRYWLDQPRYRRRSGGKRTSKHNLKTAILKHRPGESPQVHPRMLEMAAHHGFEVKAHPPRKAHQKGRVENAVGYVKKNLLGGLEIHTLESLNAAGAEWRDTIANVREHRETRKRPLDLFAEEKAHLLPLPPKPYDTAIVESVRASSQFRVSVDGNRYTVPCAYASKRLELWRYAERICFYRDGEQVARHPRCYDRGRTIEDPDHAKPLLEKRKRAGRQQKLQSFLDLTPKAEAYYRRSIKNARFPVIKTLDQFRFDWPSKINRMQVKNLFRLGFLREKGNVLFLGQPGLGKTHLGGWSPPSPSETTITYDCIFKPPLQIHFYAAANKC